jgi:hypothetical protein
MANVAHASNSRASSDFDLPCGPSLRRDEAGRTSLSVCPVSGNHVARVLFVGQARLLAARAEAGIEIDPHSVLNLLRIYRDLVATGGR